MKARILLLLIPILAACGNGNNKSDAYGNFEADEILVSAETQGKVVQFNIEEGQTLAKNENVGCIDTFSLYLKKQQLLASLEAATARTAQVAAQVAVQEEQKQTLSTEQQRVQQLVSANAAPTKQLDDINAQMKVINSQIVSTKTQNQSIAGETKALRYQVAQIDDQIARSIVKSPVKGNILEKYVEQGEVVVPGKALFKIADLSILKLRAYISGDQLSHIKIGQKVSVYIDENKTENRKLEGTVNWISQQAEFTPKIIQTKEERVNMVYAIKVSVSNDGSLKIGMPGEVKFE